MRTKSKIVKRLLTAKQRCSILRIIAAVSIFSFPVIFYAQGKGPHFFTHISGTAFYSLYQNNKNHTKATTPLFSGSVCAREEWRFSTSGAVVAGAEFLMHGLKFKSYYFAPGRSFLYNKDFDYRYKLNLYEFDFPLLLRANMVGKKRKPAEGYFEVGAALRYLFSSKIKVNDSTNIVLTEKPAEPEFENPLLSKRMSMFMQLNGGVQFYSDDHYSGLFIEFNFRYAPIRFLVRESFTPTGLYIQSFHAGFGIGYRL
jgi:hypothetical protein